MVSEAVLGPLRARHVLVLVAQVPRHDRGGIPVPGQKGIDLEERITIHVLIEVDVPHLALDLLSGWQADLLVGYPLATSSSETLNHAGNQSCPLMWPMNSVGTSLMPCAVAVS